MISDGISDFITRIRNGYIAGKRKVVVPQTKMNAGLLAIMKENGFIADFVFIKDLNGSPFGGLNVDLRYFRNRSAVKSITRISKPGRRFYVSKDELRPIFNNYGFRFMSTSKGLMTDRDAKKAGVGGEVLFELL